MEDREAIRRAHHVEHKSIRAIAREQKRSRRSVRAALAAAEGKPYTLKTPRPAPRLGDYKAKIDELLAQNAELPRKQRYTAHQIFKQLLALGYAGSEVSVRRYVAQQRATGRKRAVFLPLEFQAGQDAQVDWGEAEVVLGGVRLTAQLFVFRLNYSRKVWVRAYPAQKQEAFFDAHVSAFTELGGVPHRLTYDNLSLAVQKILAGRQRQEQRAFIAFRSHYLFESFFCTPGEGHEKGGVENGVGYTRRNFLAGLPELADFAALNEYLASACRADDARTVARQTETIATAWAQERPHLRPLPAHAFDCAVTRLAALNPYSQVTFETNRYSVPVEHAYREVLVKAYPFELVLLHADRELARHPRSYGRQQDVLAPLHYLPLLEQRPGAFEYAKPIRQWRAHWTPAYDALLVQLKANRPDGAAVPEFVQILKLHRDHPAELIEKALQQALTQGCAHLDGVRLCLHQLQFPETLPPPVDLSQRPHLAAIGQAPIDLRRYDALLKGA